MYCKSFQVTALAMYIIVYVEYIVTLSVWWKHTQLRCFKAIVFLQNDVNFLCIRVNILTWSGQLFIKQRHSL